jgi:carboxyl-terminal processing protease
MRGPKGSEIDRDQHRPPGEPQPFDLTLTRDVIKVASVRERWLEPGFGVPAHLAVSEKAPGTDVRRRHRALQDEEAIEGPGRGPAQQPRRCARRQRRRRRPVPRRRHGGVHRGPSGQRGPHLRRDQRGHDRRRADRAFDQRRLRQRLGNRRRRPAGSRAGRGDGHRRASARARCRRYCRSPRSAPSSSPRPCISRRTAARSRPRASSRTCVVERARVETFDESGRLSERDLARHLDSDRAQAAVNAEASRGLISSDLQLYEASPYSRGFISWRRKPRPSRRGSRPRRRIPTERASQQAPGGAGAVCGACRRCLVDTTAGTAARHGAPGPRCRD